MEIYPQKELVLKVAKLLVDDQTCDGRAEFWVERAAKLLPGHAEVFDLKVRLLFFSCPMTSFMTLLDD